MGLGRVFRRSVRFTFRTKRRFLVFLIIFGIVSTLIAFNIDNIDNLRTEELLEQKGVRIYRNGNDANISYTKSQVLYENITDFAESSDQTSIENSAVYYFTDVNENIRLHSLDIDNPWLSDFANPRLLQSGSYPEKANEILVPEGSSQIREYNTSDGTVTIDTALAVGQKLTFERGNEEITLEIVGTFDTSQYELTNPTDQLWLFMDMEMYEELLDLFSMTISDSQAYMQSYVVEGLILLEETQDKVQILNAYIIGLLAQNAENNFITFGDWEQNSGSLPKDATIEDSIQILTILGFSILGGIVLSTLFAYLISRFRRREIAILKAMGWSHSSVRTSLISELLTTSLSGFLFGLGTAQGIILFENEFDFRALIRFQAVFAAFIIMVIISIPGMWFASRRVLGVSPAEAFRDK